MQVSKDPPAEIPKSSYLYQWEQKVRKFYNYFEVHKKAAHAWVQRIQTNPFTQTQEFLRYLGRLKEPDILELRQQLGDITKTEIGFVNKAFAKERRNYYRKSRSEPARIVAYRKNIALVAGGSLLGLWYTMIHMRKGLLWCGAAFVPLVFYMLYNRVRQPEEDVANCYRYILAKRTATALMQEQEREFAPLLKGNPKVKELQDFLKVDKKTLYELEKKMIQDIAEEHF